MSFKQPKDNAIHFIHNVIRWLVLLVTPEILFQLNGIAKHSVFEWFFVVIYPTHVYIHVLGCCYRHASTKTMIQDAQTRKQQQKLRHPNEFNFEFLATINYLVASINQGEPLSSWVVCMIFYSFFYSFDGIWNGKNERVLKSSWAYSVYSICAWCMTFKRMSYDPQKTNHQLTQFTSIIDWFGLCSGSARPLPHTFHHLILFRFFAANISHLRAFRIVMETV